MLHWKLSRLLFPLIIIHRSPWIMIYMITGGRREMKGNFMLGNTCRYPGVINRNYLQCIHVTYTLASGS